MAQSGSQNALHTAVSELLEAARAEASVQAVIASGMITSNVGLQEVPHLRAPASYDALAAGIVCHKFAPPLGTIFLVPGVKALLDEPTFTSLAALDVLRGEEVEVLGLRELLGLRGAVVFIHYGSHHKVVYTDDDAITGSRTTLGGELLTATLEHTILRSSTATLAELFEVDRTAWRAGFHATQEQGYARAAFMVRLADQLIHASSTQTTSFLIGAVAALDLPVLPKVDQLVLYGRSTFVEPLSDVLREQGVAVTSVDTTRAELAAALGAVRLFERSPYNV